MVLLVKNDPANNALIPVIRAAILGSILANLLLCLGLCFFVGGVREDKQSFDPVISESGSGLLLTAGFGLTIPCVFFLTVKPQIPIAEANALVLKVSRATAIILLIAYLMCVIPVLTTIGSPEPNSTQIRIFPNEDTPQSDRRGS